MIWHLDLDVLITFDSLSHCLITLSFGLFFGPLPDTSPMVDTDLDHTNNGS